MQKMQHIENEIIEEFELFDDQLDKYEHLIDIGKSLPDMESQLKTDDKLVKGCQSKVWLVASQETGRVHFQADSNTAITKGIIALLIRVLSGRTPDEILEAELTFIDKINLRAHLSSQRSNGLSLMIKQMKRLQK